MNIDTPAAAANQAGQLVRDRFGAQECSAFTSRAQRRSAGSRGTNGPLNPNRGANTRLVAIIERTLPGGSATSSSVEYSAV
jgi:hypothetical protein